MDAPGQTTKASYDHIPPSSKPVQVPGTFYPNVTWKLARIQDVLPQETNIRIIKYEIIQSNMSALDVGSIYVFVCIFSIFKSRIHSFFQKLHSLFFFWQRCPPLRSSRWYAPRPVPFGECQWADGRGGQPRFGWRRGGGIARCHRGCNTWGMTGVKIDDTTFNRYFGNSLW